MLEKIIAAVVVGLLRYLQNREDLKASIRAEIEKGALEYANAALAYKLRAAGEPHAQYLRVRYGSAIIGVPGDDAGPHGATPQPPM